MVSGAPDNEYHDPRALGSLSGSLRMWPRVEAPGEPGWQVQGSTHFEIQTIARIERLSSWLRRSAGQHQVYLVGLDLAEGSLPA